MNALIILFSICALFCMGYYVFAASYAGTASAFLSFWILLTIVFAVFALVVFLQKKKGILDCVPKFIKIGFCALVLLGIIIFIVMESLIFSKMNSKADENVDYVIVLGAQVRGERVTKSLAKRLDAAYDYLVENPDCKVVCTGGKGTGEDISEAVAEKRYLMDKGLDESRIILEDKSTSTYENLKFAYEIINDKDARIAIATNNFHVYRAIKLGKYVGFENVEGIAAKSDNRLLLNYMVREALALFKDTVLH